MEQSKANQSFPRNQNDKTTCIPSVVIPHPSSFITSPQRPSSSLHAGWTSWSRRDHQLRRLPNLYTSLRGRSSAALLCRGGAGGVGKPESAKSGSCRVASDPPILSSVSSADGSLALVVRMRNLSRNLEVTLCRLAVEASPCGNVRDVSRR